ncbi:MAG: hypothetical protein ACYS18_03315 [Planctomycetota bacterium]|jgi:hypothetical protein
MPATDENQTTANALALTTVITAARAKGRRPYSRRLGCWKPGLTVNIYLAGKLTNLSHIGQGLRVFGVFFVLSNQFLR